jgi:hypothetical protein
MTGDMKMNLVLLGLLVLGAAAIWLGTRGGKGGGASGRGGPVTPGDDEPTL